MAGTVTESGRRGMGAPTRCWSRHREGTDSHSPDTLSRMRRFLAERNRSTHARGESRTRTGLPPPAPKAGASAASPPGPRLALRRARPLPVALLGEQALGQVPSFLDLAQPALDVGLLPGPALL